MLGDDVTASVLVFSGVLLGTRSPLLSTGLLAASYALLAAFRFPQVPSSRARQVLRPATATGSSAASAIAHRGGGHDAPENTVSAIREASKNGASGVELDVRFTSDGVPVLMHDDTVDRTTDGSGALSRMSFSELAALDAAAKHPLRDTFAGERIPTLQEAVEECIKLQLTIYFDVKGQPVRAAAALKELYKKHPVLYDTSVVCSFNPKVIYRTRQADPGVVTALIHRKWSLSHFGDGRPRFSSPWEHHWAILMDVVLDWAHRHLLWRLCGVSAILVHKDFVSPDCVQYWARKGVALVVWTVNTAVEKQYCQDLLHVNYITDSLVGDCDTHY